jgi:hypothetical protein
MEMNPKDNTNNSPDMFGDMMSSAWFIAKVRANDAYAQNLYAAMCNNDFQKMEPWVILKDESWSCSWRSAGGIVSDLRNEGDYLNWYCSGIMQEGQHIPGFVPEGVVTEEIAEDLKRLGWQILDDDNETV